MGSGSVVNLVGENVNSEAPDVVPMPVFLGANPPGGGHDLAEIERFIGALGAGAPGLLQTVCKAPDGLTPRFHGTDAEGIAEAVTRIHNRAVACEENTHLYVQVSTCIENPNAATDQPEFGRIGRRRGGKENVSHLLCLWSDIDYGDDGHAETKKLPLPPDAETAHAIHVASGLPEASVIVNSGGGLYEIVLLDEPYDMRDPDVRVRVESVCKRWQQRIEKTAREMGYHYGAGVANTERLLRVAGTVNTKIWDRKRRATAVYTEARYTFSDLEALINELHPEPQAPVRPDGGRIRYETYRASGDGEGLPGTDFNERGEWERDILGPAGITYAHASGDVTYWCRPGKTPRDGHGFSLDHVPDLLFSFTDGTALPQWRYFDKFSAFAWLNFPNGSGGNPDWSAAAAALRGMGYGGSRVRTVPSQRAGAVDDGDLPDVAGAVRPPSLLSGSQVRSARQAQVQASPGALPFDIAHVAVPSAELAWTRALRLLSPEAVRARVATMVEKLRRAQVASAPVLLEWYAAEILRYDLPRSGPGAEGDVYGGTLADLEQAAVQAGADAGEVRRILDDAQIAADNAVQAFRVWRDGNRPEWDAMLRDALPASAAEPAESAGGGWSEPIPLEEDHPEPYDLGRLGKLGEYARYTADAIGVPAGMALMAHLGAVSTAIGGRRRVSIRPEWTEAVVLHTLALAPPGSRKSAAVSKAYAPLKEEGNRRHAQDETAVALDKIQRDILEDRIKEARKRAVMGKTQDERNEAEADIQALVVRQLSMGAPKEHIRLRASDITPEELAYLMARHGERMAVIESEATFLSVVSGRYSQGGKPKLELMLSAYDHQSVTVDRVSRDEPVMLEYPSLTVALAIQGDAITSLGKSCAEMDKKGAWGRFLYDVSANRATRTRYTPEIPKEAERAHNARIQELMKTCYDDTEVREMTLSPEAADVFFEDYYVPNDPKYRADHHRVRIQGWDEKQPGRVIRLAAALTLYENPHATEIPASVMRDVITLDATMTAHAHKAAGFMTLSDRDPLEPARDVLDWLQGEMFSRPVKANEVQAAMRKKRKSWCTRLDDVMDALEALCEYGYLRFPQRSDGSTERRQFVVHPEIAGEGAQDTVSPVIGAVTPVAGPAPGEPMAVEDLVERAEAEQSEEDRMREASMRMSLFVAEFCGTGALAQHQVLVEDLLLAFASHIGDDGWLTRVRLGKIISRVLPDVKRGTARRDGARIPVYRGVSLL